MKKLLIILTLLQGCFLYAQETDSTYNKKKLYTLIGTEVIGYTGIVAGLSQLWYKGYDKSSFHLFNDGNEWLQMDKVGHFQSAYHINNVTTKAFQWTGLDHKRSVLYGAGTAWFYIFTIEVFDGFSEKWGASAYDLAANTAGIILYSGQELAWGKRMIIPKFSYHTSIYQKERPDALGSNVIEGLVKDYNGLTYWLSFNILELMHLKENSPFMLSFGYSAEGMVGGTTNYNHPLYPDSKRVRQYLLSLDIDLSRIKTKSKFVNKTLKLFNWFKIPFPTIELTNGKIKGHLFYY